MRLLAAVAAALVSLAACGAGAPAPAPAPEPPRDTGTVPLNRASWVATHNSYWVDRGYDDPFGSGVGLHLTDQFAGFGVRAFEIDIHRSRLHAHEFDVYHTLPGNSLCSTLRTCLRELRNFGEAAHEVVHVVLEFKEIQEPFFDPAHTIGDLDRVLRDELGGALYSPGDLLRRCPGKATLRACVAAAGWPSVESLRGHFIVVMLGNWDELGAASTAAWAQYATTHPAARAAFAMASSWMLDYTKLRPKVTQLIDAATFAAAQEESPYLQVEDLADPRIKPFLASGGIIRAGAVDSLASQEQKLALGIQMLQTDFPWVRPGGVSRASPMQPIRGSGRLAEPGRHVEIAAPTTGAVVQWFRAPQADGAVAVLSAGRDTRPVCLVSGSAAEWSGSCRMAIYAPGTPAHGAARFFALRCTAAACTVGASWSAAHAHVDVEGGCVGIASFYAAGGTDPTVAFGLFATGAGGEVQLETLNLERFPGLNLPRP